MSAYDAREAANGPVAWSLEHPPLATTTVGFQSKNHRSQFYTSIQDVGRLRELRESVWGPRSQIQEQRKVLRLKQNPISAADATFFAALKESILGKESRPLVGFALAREGGKHSSVTKPRGINNTGTVSSHQHSLFAAILTSPRNLSPNSPPSQTTLHPTVPSTIADNPPLNHQDDRPTQASRPPGSPPIRLRPEIEPTGLFSRDADAPPPPEEIVEDDRAQRIGEERCGSMLLLPLCGIAIFLGPVNIVSGMTASHGDNWKLAFVGRCLWHVVGCAASLYFFMSVLHITSDNLPQWLPTIIDCGIGTSLGFQNIPASARHRVAESVTSVIGSIFGGTQVVIRTDEQQPLQGVQAASSRGRRSDIEMGPMT
ncbi:hypothetical protein N431DRAFT_454672 [Stipitochalara longipes BDJ]|nr:hypothetical protein N431DRAFT_454672 [Stipitochalara longipes BDJ]